MPPRPSSRLDVLLVPPDDPGAVEASLDQVRLWIDRGVLTPDLRPGAAVEQLSPGGFRTARVDDPGDRVIYANQQGGFHVQCASCGEGLGREFRGLGTTTCPKCGTEHTPESLVCRPPIAVGRAAVVLIDVGDATVGSVPEGWRVVLRRVSR